MALVSVLDKYMSEFPGDVILTKWLDDVVEGTKQTLIDAKVTVRVWI